MAKASQDVGRVKEIWRYPVKSMVGERLDESKVGWHGLAGDRRFAFVRTGNKTGLPWLSARELPQLILYAAQFADPQAIEHSPLLVKTPEGRTLAVDSQILVDEIRHAYGSAVDLLQLWRGTYDSMTLSLISLPTMHTPGHPVQGAWPAPFPALFAQRVTPPTGSKGHHDFLSALREHLCCNIR